MALKMRLHRTRSEGWQLTYASGRLRHLLKIGQSLINNFVLSEPKQPLAKIATCCNVS